MSECSRKGCSRSATHSVRLVVPAVGLPESVQEPAKVYLSVELCRDHAEEAAREPLKLFPPEVVQAGFSGRRPDWGRARGEAIRVASLDYQQFLQGVGRGTPTSRSTH